jgi:hypothetical protein
MNAQSTSEPDPLSTAPWEAAPSEGSTVGARACTKSVYNSFLDWVARKSGPGAGPEEDVRSFEASPTEAATTSHSSGLSASRRRWGGPPFRARKGGQVVVRGFGGPRPTDKKGQPGKTIRQLVVRAFRIRKRRSGTRPTDRVGGPTSAGSPGLAPARGPARPHLGLGKRVAVQGRDWAQPGLA